MCCADVGYGCILLGSFANHKPWDANSLHVKSRGQGDPAEPPGWWLTQVKLEAGLRTSAVSSSLLQPKLALGCAGSLKRMVSV